MPSLGFLKKKRTREGNSDPSASSPTSPVTPTTSRSKSISKAFHLPRTNRHSTSAPSAQPTNAHQQPQQQPDHQHQEGAAPQSNQPPAQTQQTAGATDGQQQQQQQDQDMDTIKLHKPEYGTNSMSPHDHQNLPSINNLINQPQQQNNAQGNSYNNGQTNPQYLAATIDNHRPQTVSPGTDPAVLQQQQQQAMPQPPSMPPQQQQQPSDYQQSQQQYQQQQPQAQQQPQQFQQQQHQEQNQNQVPQQQQQQQPSQQQHTHQPGHQYTNSVMRVTKGKYSLGDFDILRTLGTGSFGRVHLVQSKHNQRFYAVKVLKKAQVVKMKQVEHTNDERRMLADVKHPFLITLWGTFQDSKNLYMVMDFVEGGELFSLLRKSGRFPNPVAKFYAAEVTLALEYLHSKNIIYRDLKPENLLLDRHGHLKITDFGFAKRVPDKTWTLCGTPDYLAPEVVSNKGYNKSVDWWSLGILIYEMLCGYTPFWDSGSPMKIYENILKGKVKYPAYVNADAQNLLERLITADLTKRLGNLYGGPADVKNHPWFAEVTWDRLARKDIDAPYTPPVKAGAGDASQFDRYPEDPEKYGLVGGTDEYGHMFTEF
ncbi:kinase-like domain-containing protein [Fusarium flagelliforme]|uniref:kinase-like domain-containing protein n=1 Tax=Fusarium flagelliforme TaxID=2675880 RepID=UPI001E8DE2EC|nr:kinase-like domain-containing protein [Fusarium flagelliforme]KAH7188489.1 kinase-like domain-containing protein [Fusarium flagelliforme]